jgi:hypothetical protein
VKKWIVVVGVVVLAVLSSAGIGRANERYYVWTYEYSTLAPGSAEFEFYQTATTRDRKVSGASDWTQQLELEFGITQHLDAGLYEVFEQPANGAFTYAGYKVKLRYRLAEKDVLPLDTLLYVEHQESTGGDSVFEGKVILAKEIGRFNIAYNQIYKRVYTTGKGEHEYAAGASVELTPAVRVGLESKGSYSEGEYAAGPTIAWSGARLWANLGAVFALNHKTNDRDARFLLGAPF